MKKQKEKEELGICKVHKIVYDEFWKDSDGINHEDLQEGLYNCIDCGETINPEKMKFKVVLEKKK